MVVTAAAAATYCHLEVGAPCLSTKCTNCLICPTEMKMFWICPKQLYNFLTADYACLTCWSPAPPGYTHSTYCIGRRSIHNVLKQF